MIRRQVVKVFQYSLIFGLLLLVFQNCDKNIKFDSDIEEGISTSFEAVEPDGISTTSAADRQNNSTISEQNPADIDPLPGNLDNSIPPINPTSVVIVPEVIIDPITDVTFAKCETYSLISSVDGIVNLPNRPQDSRVCYYLQVMSSINLHKSGSYNETPTTNVVANNHDGPGSTAPYSLADVSMTINWSGQWNVALSGKFNDPTAKMAIDNFFLLEIDSTIRQSVWAYGTTDALPISIDSVPMTNFTSFASSGTAIVSAINILKVNSSQDSSLDLRFRGLDCGGSAFASNVFMVFH